MQKAHRGHLHPTFRIENKARFNILDQLRDIDQTFFSTLAIGLHPIVKKTRKHTTFYLAPFTCFSFASYII